MTTQASIQANPLVNGFRSAPLAVMLALGAGILLLGLVFHTEVEAAVQVWYDSTAYSHCFFVLPIAVYLAWDRRDQLAKVAIRPEIWVVLGVVPLALAWLVAERLGIMEGRQLVALAILELLFLAVLGRAMFRALAAPLLYLVFLVPFGAFLTPALQDFTAAFINVGLVVLGIPHYSDAYIIEIPEGRFYVAEACAGLRFLIASIAFGALYACLMYRSTGRRIAFMAASVVIPIIANGFRALGIVVVGHIIGSAEAAAADHILYGWVFFSIVIMLLILAGLPFRQDAPIVQAADQPAPSRLRPDIVAPLGTLAVAVVGIAGCAAIAMGVTAGLDRVGDSVPPSPAVRFATPAGCSNPTADTSRPGVERLQFDCRGTRLDVTVQVFSPRVNPARIMAAQRRLTGEHEAEEPILSNIEIANVEPRNWRYVTVDKPTRSTATALWVNGEPAKGGLAGRLMQARNSLFGSAMAPVLIAVSGSSPRQQSFVEDERQTRMNIQGFLTSQPSVSSVVRQVSTTAAGAAG